MQFAGAAEQFVLFKAASSSRLTTEWRTLKNQNPALHSIVCQLAGYSYLTLNKPLYLTCIHRTDAEQKAIYGQNTTKKSLHQYYCAADLRCKAPYHTPPERVQLAAALMSFDICNQANRLPSGSKTVWVHQVSGNALHFHVQFWGPKTVPTLIQLPETPFPYPPTRYV